MKKITIYGGGLAGAQLAFLLRDHAAITLVSPLDYFEIPMALPRVMVEPSFATRAMVKLDEALPDVTHVRGNLVSFDDGIGTVDTIDGHQTVLSGDIAVLATGSRYANELTRAQMGSFATRLQTFQEFRNRLDQSERVLIVGGGPIGVELAGEISEDFPDKSITIVESNDRLLNGTSQEVASRAQDVLQRRGVTIKLNQRVIDPPYGVEPEGGTARTIDGSELEYDLIFWAVGSKPNTDYLPSELLTDDNRIPVDDHLRLKDKENVFAIGDIAALNEVKKAIYIVDHLKVVSKNIKSLLTDQPLKATYKAQTGNDIMLVTLGRRGGVAHFPYIRTVKFNWIVRLIKAKDMLTGMYRKKVGG